MQYQIIIRIFFISHGNIYVNVTKKAKYAHRYGEDVIMSSYAILSNDENFTIFEYSKQIIRFVTSSKLERYTQVLEWDHGYLVVMAKYKNIGEVEEYIDLIPILQRLHYDPEAFLESIKEVRIEYQA